MLQSKIQHLIPDTPLGHAINLVLAATDQEEWALAEQNLSNSELISNSDIGQVLAQPRFQHLKQNEGKAAEQQNKQRQLLEKALSDCENQLLLIEINRQMESLRQDMASAEHPQGRELLQKYQELNRKKNALKSAFSLE